MNINERKKQLRRELIAKRKELAKAEEKTVRDAAITDRLIGKLKSTDCKSVLVYISTPIEVDTLCFIKYCFENGIKVAAPKCSGLDMTFHYITGFADLECGMYGIQEPLSRCEKAVVDGVCNIMCVVPGLSFDCGGFRLGYGKGYYDRFLKDFQGVSVGICYKDYISDNLPVDEFDKRVDFLITD